LCAERVLDPTIHDSMLDNDAHMSKYESNIYGLLFKLMKLYIFNLGVEKKIVKKTRVT
jgi:hypothetical protein